MNLPPFDEAQLWDVINSDVREMSPAQRRLWEAIQIPPQKWRQHPWGDASGGFWVVAILGQTVVWYNETPPRPGAAP
jgi:hypothetical protein